MILAHSLGTAADTVPGFIWLGVTHMLRGWDHLLFIGGVVLLAGHLRRAAGLLTVFALGHSATLFTGAVAGWRVSPELVDVVIAVSVVVVGVIAAIGAPREWSWFAALVFGFGLVHGLGLATRLQALGLPQDGMITRVLAFNLGVECGQLVAVTVIFLAGVVVRDRISWRPLPRLAAGALVAAGLGAAVLVPLTATGELPFAPGRSAACTVYDHPVDYPLGTTTPTQVFAEPAIATDPGEYGYALAQGYAVVRYRPTLDGAGLNRLRAWVTNPDTHRVVAAAADDGPLVTASTAERSLRCTTVDEDALRHFTADWIGNPRSRR